jgi:hypothetical protein
MVLYKLINGVVRYLQLLMAKFTKDGYNRYLIFKNCYLLTFYITTLLTTNMSYYQHYSRYVIGVLCMATYYPFGISDMIKKHLPRRHVHKMNYENKLK